MLRPLATMGSRAAKPPRRPSNSAHTVHEARLNLATAAQETTDACWAAGLDEVGHKILAVSLTPLLLCRCRSVTAALPLPSRCAAFDPCWGGFWVRD